MVDTSLSISVSRLQQQQQYQCKRTQQEYEGVLLDASALQAAYLFTGSFSPPGKEVEETVDHVAVPPCNGVADAAEDDAVGDELVDLVQIEAVVSCCPQAFETVCQCIGNGLPATCIDVGGNGYGNHRYGDTCTCHTPIQMVICFTVGTMKCPKGMKPAIIVTTARSIRGRVIARGLSWG